MATRSSILAWAIPWTEAPGGLQPGEVQRVGRGWAQHFSAKDEAEADRELLRRPPAEATVLIHPFSR